MRNLAVVISLLMVSVFAGGCVNDMAGYMDCPSPEARQARVTEKARELVLASEVPLSSNEIEFVKREKPNIGFYVLTGVCSEDAQYFVEWAIAEEKIVVSGTGNLHELENATVSRVAK